MNDNILEVKNLKKVYPGFVLDNVNFSIPYGSIMGFIGENGAGKSTTINAILNLVTKDGGEVNYGESILTDNDKQIKEEIGVVYDSIYFYPTLTIPKIEKISKNAYSKWDSEVFHKYLTQFKLPLDKEIKNFSKGMNMKLAIAVALSHHPKLLILDEATSGLDPVVRDEILDIFLDFVQDEHHSILISSHITSDLEKVADGITFIHEGKIIFSKSKDELIYDYGIVKCNSNQFNQIDKEDRIVYRKHDYEWEVLVSDKKKFAKKYNGFVIDNPSIEDIMLLYIKGVK